MSIYAQQILRRAIIAARSAPMPVRVEPPPIQEAPPEIIALPPEEPTPTPAFAPRVIWFADQIGVERIKRIVYLDYGVAKVDMDADRREAKYTEPRHVAIFLSKTLTARTLPDLGRRFCRDHTSILHAIRKITRKIASDPALAARVEAIRLTIVGGAA